MDISAIIYAALGGGGGALLGKLLYSWFHDRRQERARRPDGPKVDGETGEGLRAGIGGGLIGGLAVAGTLASGALYKNMIFPRLLPLDDSEVIAATPIFGVIKEQSPEDYAQILYPLDRAVRQGGATQRDLDEMRAVYFKLVAVKTAAASGESLRRVELHAQSQYKTYREKAPRICTLMLNGEPFPAVDGYFSAEEVAAEQKVMVNLFKAKPRDPEFTPDLERGKTLFEAAFVLPMTEMGLTDLRPDMTETAGNEADHVKICDLAIAFLENKVALDDQDILHLTAYLQSL